MFVYFEMTPLSGYARTHALFGVVSQRNFIHSQSSTAVSELPERNLNAMLSTMYDVIACRSRAYVGKGARRDEGRRASS
ncbi:hypothetical protein RRG08_036340 [Elysia crispata]|uniref:Uncharacterized protein n=1 Tax=Elysia crispata TaxID=231223 RepID=A0AAE0ZQY9_9GAST|nr:hypothetical protein RRG08_036340 [Elysia crispata]